MKAFLLAAGNGTRLRPITETLPKCLVPIQGEPLLGIWLRHCRRQGIDEVLINLHAHPSQVREFVASQSWGLKVHFFEEAELLGSAGTLAANRPWVAGETCFGVFYADVLTNANFAPLRQIQESRRPAATLGLNRVPDPGRCGIVSLDSGGVIRAFEEKPDHPAGNVAFTGVMFAGPELFEVLPQYVPADIGGQMLPKLVGRMRGQIIEGLVIDVGTPENYALAQVTWNNGSCAGPAPAISAPALHQRTRG